MFAIVVVEVSSYTGSYKSTKTTLALDLLFKDKVFDTVLTTLGRIFVA